MLHTSAPRTAANTRSRQATLWCCLYARHFAVAQNEIGNHGYFLLAGPPDVGKSVAATAFLSSIPSAYQLTCDGSSRLAHTSDERNR